MRVGASAEQLGMASHRAQPVTPPTQRVGPAAPPWQASNAAQLRPSAAQSKTCPQLFTALPHCQPSSAQLEALGVQAGCGGASHWKAARTPQASPIGQPLLPCTTAQSKRG